MQPEVHGSLPKKKQKPSWDLEYYFEILDFLPGELVSLILDYNVNVLLLPVYMELDSMERHRIRATFSLALVEKAGSILMTTNSIFNLVLENPEGKGDQGGQDLVVNTIIDEWEKMVQSTCDSESIYQHLTLLCIKACHIMWQENVSLTPFFTLIMWIHIQSLYPYARTQTAIYLRTELSNLLDHNLEYPNSSLPALFVLDVQTCTQSPGWKKRHPRIITEDDADVECFYHLGFVRKKMIQHLNPLFDERSLTWVKNSRKRAIATVNKILCDLFASLQK